MYLCIYIFTVHMFSMQYPFFCSEEVLSGGSSEVVSNGDVGRGEGEGQVREREGRRGDEVFTEVAAQQAQRHSIMRTAGECNVLDIHVLLNSWYLHVHVPPLPPLPPSFPPSLPSSISPGMAQSDRNAALQARHRVRATTVRSRRRERESRRRDTDEETNEGRVYYMCTYMYDCNICEHCKH